VEAKRKNPEKWKRIVAAVKAGSKGGDPGEWSARKAQLAVQRYKGSGGGYVGQFVPQPKKIAEWAAKFRN